MLEIGLELGLRIDSGHKVRGSYSDRVRVRVRVGVIVRVRARDRDRVRVRVRVTVRVIDRARNRYKPRVGGRVRFYG